MSELVRLGDHITIAKGKPPAEVPFDGPGAIAYLTPEYLRGRAATRRAKPAHDAVHVADGDAVLLWDGSNAGEFFAGKVGLAASTMARIRADETIHRGYLVHALKHLEPRLKSQTNGTGIPHVDREVLEGFQVFRPAVFEQARIAQALDTLDTTIRQTEAIIEKLKLVKQGLLHDLLTRGIDDNGELRPPQSEAPQLYMDSPVGTIPAGWQCLTLDELVTAPICYGVVQVFAFVPGGVAVLAIKDLLGDYVSGVHRTAASIDAAYSRSRVAPGDVLVSVKGTIGRVGIVPAHYAGNISRDIARLRPGPAIRSGYLGQLLQSQRGQQTLALAQVGTTRAELSIGPLRKLRFAVPERQEQTAVEGALAAHDARTAAEKVELLKLRAAKSGLMDDLLTGRVRVTPLLDAAHNR